jgi:hypothetical protein
VNAIISQVRYLGGFAWAEETNPGPRARISTEVMIYGIPLTWLEIGSWLTANAVGQRTLELRCWEELNSSYDIWFGVLDSDRFAATFVVPIMHERERAQQSRLLSFTEAHRSAQSN